MTGDHIYASGIVESDDFEPDDVEGVDGVERVYTITHRSVTAVVSNIDTTDPERSTENMEAHNEVLRSVLQRDDVQTPVPISFGMVFRDERTLKNVLKGGRRAFKTALDDVGHTVEMGVKVVTDGGDHDREAVREAVRERLEPLALDVAENDLFSDRLLVNDSYLVERDSRREFDEAVGDVEEDLDDVIVQYTGPFAPYNFVDIEIGAKQ
jgi:hypothetical protein